MQLSQFKTNKAFNIGELLILFGAAIAYLNFIVPLAGNNPFSQQLIVGAANLILLALVWLSLKLHGESWKTLGLSFGSISWKNAFKNFLLSILIAILGSAGFLLGSFIMINIIGLPESADFTGYNHLEGNLGLLLITLGGVYISSSFGEEVIYRAFLIKRISGMGGNTNLATVIAVILSSVIFALIHYKWGPMGMVQTGFMGLVMGICYVKFNSRLWLLVLAHAYLDTILLVQLYLGGS